MKGKQGSELKSLTEKVNIALKMKVLGKVEAQYYLSNKATLIKKELERL